MEVALLAAGLNTLLPRLWDGRKDEKNRRSAIDANLEAIGRRINRLDDALGDAKFKGDSTVSALELKREAKLLSQQTRDCIQRFFKNKKASCRVFEKNTETYAQEIQELCVRLEAHSSLETASQKPDDAFVVADPMVMAKPVEELLDLVKQSDGRRKVISIVGFPGLGKTLLAKQVHDQDITTGELEARKSSPDLSIRARVTAAAKNPEEVLKEILKEVDTEGNHDNHNLWNLGQLLEQRLRGKRYLIVIDDIQSTAQWDDMNCAFPMDGDGTIIVTTTIQSVANVCSSCNGYVYKLPPLDKDKSLDLFLKGSVFWDRNSTKDNASDILKKCDGLPLAIVSMSQVLRGDIAGPTSDACRAACTQLGAYLLEENDVLKRMRWVLMNKYTSLTGDALRSCLLYFCLYKHKMDAVPRRNSLVRRWEAEGFLVAKYVRSRPTDVAAANLKNLVDRSIIEPMEVSADGSTRRCRPPGMMMEYVSQISLFDDFAGLMSDVVDMPNKHIRRLSFHPGSATDDEKISGMDLSLVLTLVVSGDGCRAILDFKKYDLIAVLDLKECTNLKEEHVGFICRLLLLKYLSLGEDIQVIPSEMENLQVLETLEMSRKKTVVVYAELLKLPKLKHLLGKFVLKHNSDGSNTSGVETITGFVTFTAKGFPLLMKHMKRLRKLKIYCTPTASEADQIHLQKEIKIFIRENMDDVRYDRSLSVDFTEFTDQTMCSKRILIALEYLKLDEVELGPLQVKKQPGTFQKLTRLCLVGEISLQDITIGHQALPSLVSLHLICKALHPGLQSSIGIGGVQRLNEIALDSRADDTIKDAWKTAAKGHPNRPQVFLIKNDAPIRQA